MENKINTVTIELEDYDLLKEAEFMFDDLIKEFEVIISEAPLDYSGTDLLLDKDLKRILKKYCYKNYLHRLHSLLDEKEKENND